jgi:hypothetical protein
MFEGGREKSLALGDCYATVAAERGIHYLKASDVITSSDIYGIHFETAYHQAIGLAVTLNTRHLLRS